MLLKMSISSGLLIILIIILRSLALNRLPKKVFILLWDIALLRLLIPFDLPIHYGIALPVSKMVNTSINHYNVANSPAAMQRTKELLMDTVNSPFSNTTWTAVTWAAGMMVLLVIFGVLYWKEYQKINEALPVSKEIENDLRLTVTIPKRIKLLVSDRISTPLTFGIVSPKIIFPQIWESFDNTEIKYVLAHEMIHIKRFDNLWKVVMMAAVSVHWFNPMVWIMCILFNRDMELSCDEKVINILGETTKKEYAMALVNLAEKQYQWSFFSNGFGKNAVQERIVAIMNFKKGTYASVGLAVFLLAGAMTVFAQNDSKAADKDNDNQYSASEGMEARAVSDDAVFEEGSKDNDLILVCSISYDSSKGVWIQKEQQIEVCTENGKVYVEVSAMPERQLIMSW